MKKQYTFIALLGLFMLGHLRGLAQLVGDNAFLKAAHCEVGIGANGSFGSSLSAPTGYHPNGGTAIYDPLTCTIPGSNLGFVADPDEDGWTVGTPPYYGDYFLPGTPQEGWSIEVNGTQSDVWTQNTWFSCTSAYTAGLGMYGTITGYTHAAGISTATWSGGTTIPAVSPLSITQVVTLDTNKLYFVVHVTITNTGTATATNVYYNRTLDPDNDEPESGGSFTTVNYINYQLPNPSNKVMVSATPTNTAHASAFLGLGTKDCRAKCYIINSGLTPGYNCNVLYSGASSYYYSVGSSYTNDVGVGLVYSLGNIASGSTVDLTYAYVLRAVDLDSALNATTPAAVVNSTLLLPGSDTFSTCSVTTDSIPVHINNGAAYTWAWMPATALSATTGTDVTIDPSLISSVTSYTVIGTPLSGALCTNDTFHFTVLPCFNASNNGPICAGDTLRLAVVADSGSTYYWYGPDGFTSTLDSPFIANASPANTGTYYVVRNTGIVFDTIHTVAVVNPTPSVTASSNSPVCEGSTLTLTGTDTVTSGVTYVWNGPGGFTSSSLDTSISSAPVTASGTYVLSASIGSCSASANTNVVIHPTPTDTVTETDPSACLAHDGSFTVSGLSADSTYTLTFDSGAAPTTRTLTGQVADSLGRITVPGLRAGTYSNIYITNSSGCSSGVKFVDLNDPAAPPAPAVSSNGPVCADSTLYLYASDTASGIIGYTWTQVSGGTYTSTMQNPVISSATASNSGTYEVRYEIYTGCLSNPASLNVVVNPTPSTPVVTSSPVCVGSTLDLSATSNPSDVTFTWTGPAGFTATGANPFVAGADTINSGTYTVVATRLGCPSLPGTGTAVVNPIPPQPLTIDLTYCQTDPSMPLTAAGVNLTWYTSMYGGSPLDGAPTPSTLTAGVTTYYVSQTILGCESPRAPLPVTVNTKPDVNIIPERGYVCQHDTLSFSFLGTVLSGATYSWALPDGASYTIGTDTSMGPITVRFDSARSQEVTLTVTYQGCTTTSNYNLTVTGTPHTNLYINPNICIGDTVTLALSYVGTTHIDHYIWDFDSANIITSSSGTGGPYTASWAAAGTYVVSVTGYALQNACPSITEKDTVNVHALPNATFGPSTAPGCTGDTMTVRADTVVEANSYLWGPASFFDGTNTPSTVGTFSSPAYVSLTVTDPYGCHSEDSLLYTPGSCCTVTLPNAFTPLPGGSTNTHFRPISAGHHLLSIFRITNRWGVTVFETTTTDEVGWDGTFDGIPQDMGTYYWYISYSCDGVQHTQSGDVTLIR